MTFTLHVDGNLFREHVGNVISDFVQVDTTVVPVVKGNGYGFGRKILAQEVSRTSLSKIAVGSVWELREALNDFSGSVQVLEPFNPSDQIALVEWREALRFGADRILVTISSANVDSLAELGVRHIYLEGATSMQRFGLTRQQMIELIADSHMKSLVRGLSIHLPIAEPTVTGFAVFETTADINARKSSGWALEAASWCTTWTALAKEFGLPAHVSVSHTSREDLAVVRTVAPEVHLDIRIGTRLWLGAPKSLRVTGQVLAIHEMGMGHTAFGYSQGDSHGNKRLLIVSGGTSHGVALAAPATTSTMRKRGIAIAEGFSQALGKVRSPFMFKGKNLVFAEPPHMHVSMLWSEDSTIAVGDELECTVRNTTTHFDAITGLS